MWWAVGVGPEYGEAGACLRLERTKDRNQRPGFGHQQEAVGVAEWPGRWPLAVKRGFPAQPYCKGRKTGGAEGGDEAGLARAAPPWVGSQPACGYTGGPVLWAPNPGQPGPDGRGASVFMASLKGPSGTHTGEPRKVPARRAGPAPPAGACAPCDKGGAAWWLWLLSWGGWVLRLLGGITPSHCPGGGSGE